MIVKNYNLVIGKKVLLKDSELYFEEGTINHVIGRNGSGKSQLAKDFILNRGGYFSKNIPNRTLVISSYSNLPKELTLNDVIKTVSWSLSTEIYRLLGLENVPNNIPLKKLSDGQNQKIKLYILLSRNKEIIILDEITNALDKATVNEIHIFLKKYSKKHPEKIIINISHDLSDIRTLYGNYFIIDNQRLYRISTADEAIKWYIGEI
ncbi:ATP-binding cassette domain-containing protein [Streptococcus suis]|nr:ATP-binding cassette domain-containing protein [Streptococcus suis]